MKSGTVLVYSRQNYVKIVSELMQLTKLAHHFFKAEKNWVG